LRRKTQALTAHVIRLKALDMKKIVAAVFLGLVLAGCKTASVKSQGAKEGYWTGRALIKDLEKSKSFIVNIDFNLVRGEVARMDITSTIGTSVASMVTTASQTRYALYDLKQFYTGEPKPSVMRPILAIPFNPVWLQNVLFEIPFTESNWKCTNETDGRPSLCQDSQAGLKISWERKDGDLKSIVFEHSKALVQIRIKNFKPKVEGDGNIFVLESPKGFRNLRVK
jgi:hypothetical protein